MSGLRFRPGVRRRVTLPHLRRHRTIGCSRSGLLVGYRDPDSQPDRQFGGGISDCESGNSISGCVSRLRQFRHSIHLLFRPGKRNRRVFAGQECNGFDVHNGDSAVFVEAEQVGHVLAKDATI